MLFFQKIELEEMPLRYDPLYVGHFFKLDKMWWRKRRQRQEMIISVAITWLRATRRQLSAPGMIEDELFLTRLTSQVRDARKIIEFFFEITRLGFNLGDGVNHGPTIVRPRKLHQKYIDAIEKHLNNVIFAPGPEPTSKHLVQTTVNVRHDKQDAVIKKLKDEDREDLIPAVTWLYQQGGPISFYYRPAGRLQARDTSLWPIRAIETWPGWLRTELFGTTIDLENAFCQFLLEHLEKKYAANRKRLELLYPDLLRAAYDKQAFREELCRDVLHLPPHDENISTIKRLIMALANGSNVTVGLLAADSQSQAVRIIKQVAPDLTAIQLDRAGTVLSRIAKQFRMAKKDVCSILDWEPTRENTKKIFEKYFEWEKEARYKMWEMTGFTGISAHDGLDGINIENPETFADEVFKRHGLRVKVEV